MLCCQAYDLRFFNFPVAIAGVTIKNSYNLKNVTEVKDFIFTDISTTLNISLQEFEKNIRKYNSSQLNKKEVQKIVTHPVHIVESSGAGDLSPSALIPFCQFGEEWIGVKTDRFDVPTCNSFQATILNDKHFEHVLVCCGYTSRI